MRMDPYLMFDGTCEAALSLYAKCLAGRMGSVFRYAGSPMMDQVPADWADKIMHASLELPDRVLMGADSPPGTYRKPQGFTLSLQIANTDEAERAFGALAEGATVIMPLEKTFWAERFGVLVDRFGIPWQVNCEGDGVVSA